MLPFDYIQRVRYPYGRFKRIRLYLLEQMMRRSIRHADLVIFVSQFANQTIEQRLGQNLKKSLCIPHGVADHFKVAQQNDIPKPTWLPKDDYFLYVSLFGVFKNQIEVVRGFNFLRQKRFTPEKLVLVGPNHNLEGNRVRREILKLGLKNDVMLIGTMEHKSLPAVYRHAKVNIFASECENCPNILLEAMGAGRPLMVSDRLPMPEFAGDAAVYFDPSSPEDLANKMALLLDDSSRIEQLAEKARERSAQFDWHGCARRTWQAIADLHNGCL